MGFSIETSISATTVFLQGLLSFFSPCVLPLIPLYMGYLSGGTKTVDADGTVHYKRSKVMANTVFFVLGISFAFFLLGFGFTAAGRFFGGNRIILSRIGGIIVMLFGLYQIGLFGSSQMMGKERRLPLQLNLLAMNPITALILGFTFSFAWTPCVGPALASVLIMTASATSSTTGFALIGIYTLGFILPFLAVGFFTGTLLEVFKKYRRVVSYTVKIGGVLMVLMGFMMFTGWMNNVTGYLSKFGALGQGQTSSLDEAQMTAEQATIAASVDAETSLAVESSIAEETTNSIEEVLMAPDFTLTDQYGNVHRLSDYQGKTVFLNFWATWCPPCRAEMPEIQEIYQEYGNNEGDLIVLGVAGPNVGQEGSAENIIKFLADNGYTYPTVMSEGGDLFVEYGVLAYPTTFMISPDGSVFGYAQGQLTKDIIKDIIKQTMEGKRSE